MLLALILLSTFGHRYVQALIGLQFLAEVPAALSLVFRYRSAGGLERQQIRWFAYAASIFTVFPRSALVRRLD
jgi:hypothetical protein